MAVPDGGYAWWYVDVLSDDGQLGLTCIVFVGSVFSPRYAAARARGPASAHTYPAVNLALYRPGGDRWVMTERAPSALARSRDTIEVGHSSMRWEDDALVIRFDEACATFPSPLPASLRGEVRIMPRFVDGAPVGLDGPGGQHRWFPIAPSARAEVRLHDPLLRFAGEAYWDANTGQSSLESAFLGWQWSRMSSAAGTTIAYHTAPRSSGQPCALVRRYDRSGRAQAIALESGVRLPRTRWGLDRRIASDEARLVRTLEDTPFYARSLVAADVGGQAGVAIHETLDAARFAARWVQFLLPFRARTEGT